LQVSLWLLLPTLSDTCGAAWPAKLQCCVFYYCNFNAPLQHITARLQRTRLCCSCLHPQLQSCCIVHLSLSCAQHHGFSLSCTPSARLQQVLTRNCAVSLVLPPTQLLLFLFSYSKLFLMPVKGTCCECRNTTCYLSRTYA